MAQVDRSEGLVGNTAFKAPVELATTGNITLSGEQTIDGVLTNGSRVLVKNQTNAVENGIYTSDTQNWQRTDDFDGAYDIANGSMVYVVGGASNDNTIWRVNTSNPVIGSAITFSAGIFGDATSLQYVPAGAQATPISVQTKLRADYVDLVEYEVSNSAADQTAKIQKAVDDLPDTGGRIRLPPYRIYGSVKLQGTSGNKTNVILCGHGKSSELQIPAGSDQNVVEMVGTTGCGVEDMVLIGSRGNGGSATPGPNKGLAVNGQSLVVGDRVEVSSTDTYTTTVAASNRVYRCTSNVVLGALFATSLASFALTTEANFNTSDLSYRYNNGIYADDSADCYARNVTAKNCIYAGFNPGTGPVQAANAGPGADRFRIIECEVDGCDNGTAGGLVRDFRFNGLTILNCVNYGVVVDADGGDGLIDGVNIQGCGNNAIYAYNYNTLTIDGYTISDCLNGVVIDVGSTRVALGKGTIINCTNVPVLVRNSNSVDVDGLIAHNNVGSVEIDSCYAVSLKAIVSGASGSGKSNIKISASSLVQVLPGTKSYGANLHGLELSAVTQSVIAQGLFYDNNTSNNVNGSGIFGTGCTNLTIRDNIATDTRAASTAKTQVWALNMSTTDCDGLSITGNRFAGNKTTVGTSLGGTGMNIAGSANTVHFNENSITPGRIGNAVLATTTSSGFVAQTIVPFYDAGGTLRYGAAMNTTW